MRKYKFFIRSIAITIPLLIVLMILYFKDNHNDINWIKDLSYEESQIYDISFQLFNPCPSIPVKIGDKECKLLFDTGNGVGFVITTALEDKVDYELVGTTV